MHWHVNIGLAYAEKYLTYLTNRLLQKVLITLTPTSRQQSRDQQKLLSFLKQLRRLVESIPISTDDFQKAAEENPFASAQGYSDVRALNGEVIAELLTQLQPDSILDLNSGNGLIAKQAANLGSRVVCFEMNHSTVSELYREAKTKGLSILPLVMDFTKPTPARGIGNHWAISAAERFQCDLVLALGLTNQLMPRRLEFEQIIGGFSQFSKRWLVLEIPFDPESDCSQTKDNQPKGLSLEGCIRLLERQFRTITKIHSPVKGSTLLLCEK
jgi:hypothetical protein